MDVCVDLIMIVAQVREELLVAHFDAKAAKDITREDRMITLVETIKEIVTTQKGSGFDFGHDFDVVPGPSPTDLP